MPAPFDIASSGKGGGIFRLSITRRVFLVGAMPIVLAVLLGVGSIVLFDRADEARRGALTVSAVFRNVVSAMSARDDFIAADPSSRDTPLGAFMANIGAATAGLSEIGTETSDGDVSDAVTATIGSLERFRRAMGELQIAIEQNDARRQAMSARLDRLIALAQEASGRQQAANAGVVAQLRQSDRAMREALDLTSAVIAMRGAVIDSWLRRLRANPAAASNARPPSPQSLPEPTPGQAATAGQAGAQQPISGSSATGVAASEDSLAAARLANAADGLRTAFRAAGRASQIAQFEAELAGFRADGWPERLLTSLSRSLKIDGSAVRAAEESFAGLLDNAVAAQTTEERAQDITVETIRLGEKTREAMRLRDSDEIARMIERNTSLREAIAGLPISPIVQSEMLDALDSWRRELAAAHDGLAAQNAILRRMAVASTGIVFEVSNLNSSLSTNADDIGTAARRILIVSAVLCLLVAMAFGLGVARSITLPLKRLEQGMLVRAADPTLGPLPEAQRTDEIGRMTRATNHFLDELTKREAALLLAKDETDRALAELKRTQRDLIQSEKLASLGQLVAGVAHEINTPLGVALTTSTVMRQETEKFRRATSEGKVTRQAFDDFIERTGEGTALVDANLSRAAGLVVSFKQVAADQASGERRAFRMDEFIEDLFRSLGPMRRRAGHELEIDCEGGIAMVSYPGALSQVLTNLLTNAYAHAFEEGETGRIEVRVRGKGPDRVEIVFSDDGRGIAAGNLARIFDPFFTTGRASGSTGLGLHIVHNLVTATLGGSIETVSALGGGTSFVIDIPRVSKDASAAAHDPAGNGSREPALNA
ncbi:histidine kinase [Aurantimonas sp. 22II-16-19i]|nr:histidine kinase [Aurantimonas sp. 22II-16-19i]